jgi:hypothetical protein
MSMDEATGCTIMVVAFFLFLAWLVFCLCGGLQ